MNKPFKLILSVICAVLALTVLSVTAFAASGSGISVSDSELSPGDTFTVTLSVPSAEAADTASIRVEFDASVFEVTSWAPTLANGFYNSGDGFFALTSANAVRAIDLSRGAEFTATMSVKRSAASGTYPIKLVSASFSYVKDNGYDYVELWTPAVTEVQVKIGSGTGASSPSITTSQSPAVTTSPSVAAPSPISSTTKTTTASTTPLVSATKQPADNDDAAADTTRKADENAAALDDDEDEYPEAGDSVIYDTDNDDGDTTAPVNGGGSGVEVTYKVSLGGLPDGKIHISTSGAAFDRDTRIVLTGNGGADNDALNALKSMGLGKHDYYAFDISLYDAVSNKRVNTLKSGSVGFAIPVPKKLTGAMSDLSVYHISGGKATSIPSRIAFENGQYRIKFSASDFSTYVIVDMVGELADNAQASIVDTTNSGSSGTGVRPLNPNTGVTAAIAVPAALVGCALLSRKVIKKRKRKKTYVD